jgi:hypothetical protein
VSLTAIASLFDREMCDRLNQDERDMWKDWSKQQHEKRKLAINLKL